MKTLKEQFHGYLHLFSRLTDNPPYPLLPVEPVLGLQTYPNIQVCQTCKRGFSRNKDQGEGDTRQSNSFKSHQCQSGIPHAPRQFEYRTCQRFGPGQSYFEVAHPRKPVPGSDLWHKYRQAMESRPLPTTTVSSPHDDRAMDRFLYDQGWVEHIRGIDLQHVVQLCRLPSEDSPYVCLVPRIQGYLAYMQRCIQTHTLRRKLGVRPASEHEKTYERHHRDVRYETHIKYARWLAQSVYLILRNVCHRDPRYSFDVSDRLREMACALDEALNRSDDTSIGLSIEDDIDDDDNSDDDEENTDHPLSFDRRAGTSDSLDTVTTTPYASSEYRRPPTYNDLIQRLLIQLLEGLYTLADRDGKHDPFRHPFIRYVVVSSVKISGQWMAANDITPKVSALLFTGRVTLGRLMLLEWKKSPDKSLEQ
jgi:hypothetical protein